jgi:hypothetical protein
MAGKEASEPLEALPEQAPMAKARAIKAIAAMFLPEAKCEYITGPP